MPLFTQDGTRWDMSTSLGAVSRQSWLVGPSNSHSPAPLDHHRIVLLVVLTPSSSLSRTSLSLPVQCNRLPRSENRLVRLRRQCEVN